MIKEFYRKKIKKKLNTNYYNFMKIRYITRCCRVTQICSFKHDLDTSTEQKTLLVDEMKFMRKYIKFTYMYSGVY